MGLLVEPIIVWDIFDLVVFKMARKLADHGVNRVKRWDWGILVVQIRDVFKR